MVNLNGGESVGQTRYKLTGIEDVAGSPFDEPRQRQASRAAQRQRLR
jgi:hypothetical protein